MIRKIMTIKDTCMLFSFNDLAFLFNSYSLLVIALIDVRSVEEGITIYFLKNHLAYTYILR